MQTRFATPTICAIAIFSLFSGGCWSYRPTTRPVAVARTEAPDVSTWPTRDVEPLKPILEKTPPEVVYFGLVEGVDRATLTADEKNILDNARTTVHYKGIHGLSLLRIFDWKPKPRVSETTSPDERFSELFGPGFPANARTISSRTLSAADDARTQEARLAVPAPKEPQLPIAAPARPPNEQRGHGRVSMRVLPIPYDQNLHLESGKPIRIPPIKKPGEYKGLVLHFQAISYNEFEPRVLEEFERRGWAVIDISTESSTQPPMSDEQIEQYKKSLASDYEILAQIYADKAKEFTLENAPSSSDEEAVSDWVRKFNTYDSKHPLYPKYAKQRSATGKLRAGSFQACEGADLDLVARQIASRVDQALAGNAYAAQTCLEYALTQRPDLQNIPVVMIGFSAGALTTPTAAALLRDQLDAVVVIGGAANLFMVTQKSVFTDGGIKVRCGTEKVPAATTEAISELYLKHTKLDPYYTAPMIAHLPILQVHASSDDWVPAAYGDILFERLGKPDQLTIGAGHELLFYFLPGKADFIANWVENATSHHATPPPVAPTETGN